jgi:hypothetical protein
MEKVNFQVTGTVTNISDLIQVVRTVKPVLFKKIVTVKTIDEQILFLEIQNANLKMLDREGIEVDILISADFVFKGSQKDGKLYNNLIITSIQRI